ncbi:MAG: CDP-diacylglycerol--glycerol-3-phosphate 3-phosphatidyltransferase [Anaerolineaceae bacterium]|nr:CDP-diacylglycerol--glycerol-3-phosphate 3-phosphatidyltransferase [Anaerolineaceae bacterium]
MDRAAQQKRAMTLTDFLRVRFKGILDPIGKFLNGLGLTPNTMTVIGLVGNMVAAWFLAKGFIVVGGLIILLTAPIDAIDGTMARLRGQVSRYGAFLDSVADRYSELVVFAGLLYYFLQQQNFLACLLTFFAAAGSIMVSYTRARAEALSYNAKIGLMTRIERYLILVPMLLLNRPMIALWVLAILANFTAIQRVWSVRKQAYDANDVVRLEKNK